MGLFDLPAPLFQAVDNVAGSFVPDLLRLLLWGVFAGWFTMIVYRKLSNQDRISALKQEQKVQQQQIAGFDGEFEQLWPLIRNTLSLGFRQLGLAIVPALLASLPVLFLVAWVAGQFGYQMPDAGQVVEVEASPVNTSLSWSPAAAAQAGEQGWSLAWPETGTTAVISSEQGQLLSFPLSHAVPVIHKKQWWNGLFANPLGYVDEQQPLDQLSIGLTAQEFLPFGPAWLRGWMFTFFGMFLLSSLAFKFILKID